MRDHLKLALTRDCQIRQGAGSILPYKHQTASAATMASSLTSFPNEVLTEIFSYLVPEPVQTGSLFLTAAAQTSRDALNSLSRTSKHCQEIAQPLLYRHVIIKSPQSAVILCLALLSRKLGSAIRHFACLIPLNLGSLGHCWNALIEFSSRSTPALRQMIDNECGDLFRSSMEDSTLNHGSIVNPECFLVRIVLACIGQATHGDDILLQIPDESQCSTFRDFGHRLVRYVRDFGSWQQIRLQVVAASRQDDWGWASDSFTDTVFERAFYRANSKRLDFFGDKGSWAWALENRHNPFGDQEPPHNGHSRSVVDALKLPRLEELRLYNSATDPFWIRQLLTSNPKLRRLTLTYGRQKWNNNCCHTGQTQHVSLDTALLESSATLECLHLEILPLSDYLADSRHNISGRYDRITCLRIFQKLRHLSIDILLLSGVVVRNEAHAPAPRMADLLPISLETITLIERWDQRELWRMKNSRTTQVVAQFYDVWMEELFSSFINDCCGREFPNLRQVSLQAYLELEHHSPFRGPYGIQNKKSRFKSLNIDLIWKWHDDYSNGFGKPACNWTMSAEEYHTRGETVTNPWEGDDIEEEEEEEEEEEDEDEDEDEQVYVETDDDSSYVDEEELSETD